MPVVVEFLLLDEDLAVAPNSARQHRAIATGHGIFLELERQLQDPNSHLRRKSAFGALVSRGATLRQLREERFEDGNEPGIVKPLSHETLGLAAGGAQARSRSGDGDAVQMSFVGSQPSAPRSLAAAPSAGGDQSTGRRPKEGIAQVPKILAFPKPAPRSTVVPASGLEFFSSFLSWVPSCTPVCCNGASGQAVDACTIFVAEAEHLSGCGSGMPLSAAAGLAEEAGLGGWPLCVPNAFVACLPPQEPDRMAPQASAGARAPGSLMPSALAASAKFNKAAVEVDDFELTVVFVPVSGASETGINSSTAAASAQSGCLSGDTGRHLQTPSTVASTAAFGGGDASEEVEEWPPPWVTHNRMTLSREGICSFQAWPATGGGRCGPRPPEAVSGRASGDTPPWPHLVEVMGTPRGAPRVLSILLAFPTAGLASRVVEALSRVRQKRDARPSGLARGSPCAAARCELRIDADLDLGFGGSDGAVNCAAVVRRGIAEACHVGADRVRICGVHGVGSAAAAFARG